MDDTEVGEVDRLAGEPASLPVELECSTEVVSGLWQASAVAVDAGDVVEDDRLALGPSGPLG